MAVRPADERVRDFLEVDAGFSREEAIAEAERCLQCKKPLCVEGCPVGIDIPAFIALIAEGDICAAAGVIQQSNMLPAICGRVCPQETQCEERCILGIKESPVRIGQLERYVADYARKEGLLPPQRGKSTGKRVAVVGSGPAGITAAAELATAGHDVIIFESLHKPGGVLTYGIPAFRLPKDIVDYEINRVLSLGVRLLCNHIVGRSISIQELLGYDAVLLGTGAGLPYFMNLPGEHLNGVYSANEFLTRINLMHADQFPLYDTPVIRGSRVVVAGAGNVAMDAARAARRLGGRVTLVYRRREEDMPARAAEIAHAREEGITFVTCANPVEIQGETVVTGVSCIKMNMCEADESGRPSAVPIPDSLFLLDADIFIQAIGQGPNPLLLSLFDTISRGKAGNVIADADGKTSLPRVFAAGDVTTGSATVIEAMGAAKKAAKAICRMLQD